MITYNIHFVNKFAVNFYRKCDIFVGELIFAADRLSNNVEFQAYKKDAMSETSRHKKPIIILSGKFDRASSVLPIRMEKK